MWAGFLVGTMTTSLLRVNTTGFEQSFLSCSCRGRAMSAEAKTSAGAPCSIWAASVFEPAKE